MSNNRHQLKKSSCKLRSALYQKVGRCMRSLRESRGLSQIHVAESAGISPRHYQEIEYGTLKCRIDTLEKVLRVYGKSIFFFFATYTAGVFHEKGLPGYIEATGDDNAVLIQTNSAGIITSITGAQSSTNKFLNSISIGTTRCWELFSKPDTFELAKLSFEMTKAGFCPPTWWDLQIPTKDHQDTPAQICWREHVDKGSGAKNFELLLLVD